jgi:HAD superfamily hydrolase (TIGR01509 family)
MAMITLAGYQGFIFDLDGTLIDSEKYHLRAFALAMRELAGYELTPADGIEFIGRTSSWLAARLAERHGLRLDAQAVAARRLELLDREFRAELYPGAGEFVRAQAARLPLAVASNSPRQFVLRALAECGLRDCFAVVTAADDVQRRKPDPEMVLLTLARLGTPAARTLVLEDTVLGVEAAQQAGCPVVLVDNGMAGRDGTVPAGVPVVRWPELLPRTPAAAGRERKTRQDRR